jgi:succinate dehydrogenase / fumarate reductase cytochrome b subunit
VALTGLFLILFLAVHLIGNLQMIMIFSDDGGRAFNEYAHFMGHNELIQIISIGNFFFIILHIIVSVVLTIYNRSARPKQYAYSKPSANSSFSSRNMIWLGSIVLIFLVLHLVSFWAKSKFGGIEQVTYDGQTMHNLYDLVVFEFQNPLIVGIYVVSMIGLSYHLMHGFQSVFQTLGINHVKYTPFIKTLGLIYSIAVPLGFAVIPILMYVKSLS